MKFTICQLICQENNLAVLEFPERFCACSFSIVQDKGYRNSTSRQVILQMLKDNRVLGGGILAQKPWPAFAHYFSHGFQGWGPYCRNLDSTDKKKLNKREMAKLDLEFKRLDDPWQEKFLELPE